MRLHIHRAHIATRVMVIALLVFSVFLIDRGMTRSAPTITAQEWVDEEGGNQYLPGTENVPLGVFDVVVGEDDIIVNGASYVITEGAELTALEDAGIRFVDDGDGEFEAGEIVMETADDVFDVNDIVLIGGALEEFPATPTPDSHDGTQAWLDQNSNGVYDAGEDMVTMGPNAELVEDGDLIRLFAPGEVLATNGSPISQFGAPSAIIDSQFYGYGPVEPAFINDNDGDGYLSAGDTVRKEGVGHIDPLDADDNVCFFDEDEDSEFDYVDISDYESIWWDAAGDCVSFDTGVDIVLAGTELPTGSVSKLFGGAESSVGYLGSDDYICARGDECREIVYTGNGSNWNADSNFIMSSVFFDASDIAVDGLKAAANEWQSPEFNHLNTLTDLSDANGSGDAKYVYVDSNLDTNYDDDEPLLGIFSISTDTNVATNQVIKLYTTAGFKYLNLTPGTGFWTSRNALIESADAYLDEGAIDGTGTDRVVYVGLEDDHASYDLFPTTGPNIVYYHDHDASGSFAVGDDIINHTTGTGLYNADDLLTVGFGALSNDATLYSTDTMDAMYLYSPAGESCAGAGTDTLIASYVGGDFEGQAIAVTADPLVFSDNGGAGNRLCVYGDVSEDAYLGLYLIAQLTAGDTEFLSGALSSSTLQADRGADLTAVVDVQVSQDPGYTGAANTVTFEVESPGRVLGEGYALGLFPITIDVTGASMACSKNGVLIPDGMSVAQNGFALGDGDDGPVFNAVGFLAPNLLFEAGDSLTCVVSNLTGPEDEGVYVGGAFLVDLEEGATPFYDQNVSYTFLDEPAEDEDGGGRTNPDIEIIAPPDYGVTLVTPNGGEVLKAGSTYSISWTADPEVQFVNMAYSLDGGESYRDIVRGITNTGSFLWRVPLADTERAMIRIQSTDLGAVLNRDESDDVFRIVDPAKPFITWRSPAAESSLQSGSKQWLLWDSSPIITDVELSLSTDGGVTYPVTTGRVRNENAYQVQLPAEPAEAAYVKLVGYAKGYEPITVIAGPFAILSTLDDSAIKVTAPNTLQAFVPGQKTMITWETKGEVPLVEVQFAPDGKTWVPISEFISNTGSFEWTVPDVESQYAFIRVGGKSVYGRFVHDKSDEPFWIVRTIVPAITITAPKAGSAFDVGSVMEVLWDSAGEIPSINLYMVFANGMKEVVALGTKNTQMYEWTIPEIPFKTFELLIEGLDAGGNVVARDTEGPFNLGTFLGPCGIGLGGPCNPPVDQDPCILGALRPNGRDCESGPVVGEPDTGGEDGPEDGDGEATDDEARDNDDRSGAFIAPSSPDGGDQGTTVNIAIFDQTGLDLYKGSVTPRVSVANKTIELDPSQTVQAIIGTNVLVELIADEGNFTYSTNDGRTELFETDAAGVRYAYVPVGSETTHVKVQSQDLSPPFTMSLRVAPQPLGTVSGLEGRDGTERVVLLQGSSEWDASASGQVNPLRLAQDGSFAWYAPNGRYEVEVRNQEGSLYIEDVVVRNNIINPQITLMVPQEEVVEAVSPLVDILIPDDVQEVVLAAVEDIRSNETAQTAAAIAIPVSAAAVVTGATVLGTSFNLLNYLQYLFTSPIFLFSRKKKKGFGTVYNSLTKAPIPFATIRFYDKENRIARTVVTDTSGHYTLALPPGMYRPVVVKLGYLFPSEHVLGAKDGELEGVYTSGYITVTSENPIVHAHFPLDPNQVAARIVSLRRATVLRAVQYSVALGGFVLSAYATFINPTKTSVALLAVQVVVVAVSVGLTKLHSGPRIGKVIDAQGKPLAGVVVRLFEATYNKLIETQRTDTGGRYNFMAKDGQFYVVAETPRGKVTSQKIDYRGIGDLKAVAPVLKI